MWSKLRRVYESPTKEVNMSVKQARIESITLPSDEALQSNFNLNLSLLDPEILGSGPSFAFDLPVDFQLDYRALSRDSIHEARLESESRLSLHSVTRSSFDDYEYVYFFIYL